METGTAEQGLEIGEDDKIERDKQYARMLVEITQLQNRIDSVAEVAALEIGRLRRSLDHRLHEYEVFLKSYAKAHLPKRIKRETGETELIKNCRSVVAGAGVYFEVKKGSFNFPDEPEHYAAMLLAKNIDPFTSGLIEEETKHTIKDPVRLIQALKQHTNYDTNTIEVIDDDEFGKMKVGTKRGWTPNAAQKRVSEALHGKSEEVEE